MKNDISSANLKLSIITITLNNLAALKNTLSSISKQPNYNFELIVVDGQSTDGTVDFLQQFRPSFRFKFVSEKDSGIYDAMNKGVTLAQGDYVWFLNAGDDAADNSIQNILETIGEKSIYFFPVLATAHDFSYTKGQQRQVEEFDWGLPYCHQGILYKKADLPIPAYDLCYKIAADYHLTYRLIKNNPDSWHFTDVVIARFSLDGKSSTDLYANLFEQCSIRWNLAPWNQTPKVAVINILLTLKITLVYLLRISKLYRRFQSLRANKR